MLNKYWTKPQKRANPEVPMAPFTHNGVSGWVTVDWLRAHNSVTHRDIGNIPGIVEAPRSGTFKAISVAEARKATAARADAYGRYIAKYIAGEYRGDGNTSLREMWKDVATMPPLFGAYGEKL